MLSFLAGIRRYATSLVWFASLYAAALVAAIAAFVVCVVLLTCALGIVLLAWLAASASLLVGRAPFSTSIRKVGNKLVASIQDEMKSNDEPKP